MVPQLPHELSDHIIDFLYDDGLALSACSLTCRAFLAVARYHRFSVTWVWGRLGPFIVLLDSSPEIAPFIKTLRLDGIAYPLRRRVDPMALLATLNRLPALRYLGLRHLELDAPLVQALSDDASFKNLKGLDLDRCLFDSLDDLICVIRTPSLEHLSVQEPDYPDNELGETTLPPAISSLEVSGLWNEKTVKIAKWLTTSTSQTPIRKLRSYITSNFEAESIAPILQTLGEALESLEIVVDPESSLQAVFNESGFSLSCLPNIRQCHLTFKLREMFVEGTVSLPWINSTITQISSAALEELVICIQADDMEDLRALDSECGVRAVSPVRFEDLCLLNWREIHQTFHGSVLRRVVVEGRGDMTMLQAHVAEQCPEFGKLIYLHRVGHGR